MTKDQKNEVIELLKDKFSQYNNFYVTDTESLTVEQVGKLRRACFNKRVEMKVAKNTLIRKTSYHKETNIDKPVLKAAFIDGDVFSGDNQLKALATLRSKQDLIGEIIGLLQSPAKNVISSLNAGGKLASLIKALEEKAQA